MTDFIKVPAYLDISGISADSLKLAIGDSLEIKDGKIIVKQESLLSIIALIQDLQAQIDELKQGGGGGTDTNVYLVDSEGNQLLDSEGKYLVL